MRGFSTKSLRKQIIKGLRQFKESPETDSALVECYNLVPGEDGLKVFEPIISLNADGVSWGGEGISPDISIYPSDVIEFEMADIDLSVMR